MSAAATGVNVDVLRHCLNVADSSLLTAHLLQPKRRFPMITALHSALRARASLNAGILADRFEAARVLTAKLVIEPDDLGVNLLLLAAQCGDLEVRRRVTRARPAVV